MDYTIDLLCPKTEWEWQGSDLDQAQSVFAEHIKTCGAPVVLNIEIPMVSDLAGVVGLIGALRR
jgi:hypothetical protein